jgi:GNAT superfamily N-acetyltransferase
MDLTQVCFAHLWDQQPAGYALFFKCYSTFQGRGLFLEDFYVRPEFRGKKIGDSLLARVADIALRENCFGIMLNVLNWNQPAINFFRNRGFKILERKTACLETADLQILVQRQNTASSLKKNLPVEHH